MLTQGGTFLWSAPEVLQRRGNYSAAADVFSYGTVLWELATRRMPFDDGTSKRDVWEIVDFIRTGGTPKTPKEAPKWLREMMERCWRFEPIQRPTFEELLEELETHVEERWDEKERVPSEGLR
jgi:serine/threonine protein kinase